MAKRALRLASLSKTEVVPLNKRSKATGALKPTRPKGPRSKDYKPPIVRVKNRIPSEITIIEGVGKDRVECICPTIGMLAVPNEYKTYDFYDKQWIYKWSRRLRKHVLHENT